MLRPTFLRHPQAVIHWMAPMCQQYVERCQKLGVEPDAALLGPIVEVFERLKSRETADRRLPRLPHRRQERPDQRQPAVLFETKNILADGEVGAVDVDGVDGGIALAGEDDADAEAGEDRLADGFAGLDLDHGGGLDAGLGEAGLEELAGDRAGLADDQVLAGDVVDVDAGARWPRGGHGP